MGDSNNITKLIQRLPDDNSLYEVIYPIVYNELKKMAGYRMSMERKDHTISKTELVHEVYIKMVDSTSLNYNDYSHFKALASSCMRQLLIDHARKKNAKKRGEGKSDLTYIDGIYKKYEQSAQDMLNIEKALEKLEKLNKRLSDVVTMRFFGEMKIGQIAQVLDVSESTVNRDWKKAKGFLYNELK